MEGRRAAAGVPARKEGRGQPTATSFFYAHHMMMRNTRKKAPFRPASLAQGPEPADGQKKLRRARSGFSGPLSPLISFPAKCPTVLHPEIAHIGLIRLDSLGFALAPKLRTEATVRGTSGSRCAHQRGMERSDIACVSSPKGERGGAQQPPLRGEGWVRCPNHSRFPVAGLAPCTNSRSRGCLSQSTRIETLRIALIHLDSLGFGRIQSDSNPQRSSFPSFQFPLSSLRSRQIHFDSLNARREALLGSSRMHGAAAHSLARSADCIEAGSFNRSLHGTHLAAASLLECRGALTAWRPEPHSGASNSAQSTPRLPLTQKPLSLL
jgi:hypothetical protein